MSDHPARSQQLLDVCHWNKSPWCCTRACVVVTSADALHTFYSVSKRIALPFHCRFLDNFSSRQQSRNSCGIHATDKMYYLRFFYRLRHFQKKTNNKLSWLDARRRRPSMRPILVFGCVDWNLCQINIQSIGSKFSYVIAECASRCIATLRLHAKKTQSTRGIESLKVA